MGSVTLQNGETVVYSGDDEVHQGGVAITMSAKAKRALLEWTPISKRIITARFYSKYKKMTVIQAYAPTNDTVDEEKDEFYNQLQDTVSSCNRHDMIAVMGDMSAKVGNNNTNREEVMGRFGIGVMNDNGKRLCDFGSANGLVITGTIFPHKGIHKLTWRSPDGRTLARTKGEKIARERFDVCKLQSEEIRRGYNIEMRNRFEALGDIEDPKEEHDLILATYRDAAKEVIRRSKKQSKPWIGDKTWEKIKERKEAKLKMEGARSERLKQRRREEYDATNTEVKRSAKEDKRN
ncbi:hypothetical protein ACROYT_G021887 [Oculina patagonica]